MRMNTIKIFSMIEIDFEEMIADSTFSDAEYEIAFTFYEKTMLEMERQFFQISKKEGFIGDLEEFREEVLNLRS